MTTKISHIKRSARVAAALAVSALLFAGCSAETDSADQNATPTDSAANEQEEAPADSVAQGSAVSDVTGFDNVVVSTDWLADNLDSDTVKVIEVSTEVGLYERGHIAGAVNFPWHTAFVETVTRDIVSQEDFTELVQAAGINAGDTVVLYGDKNNWFAAWGAWIFELYGFEDIRLLDGGRTKWEAESRPYEVAAPAPTRGTWEAAPANQDLRALKDEVLTVVTEEQDVQLLDIRSVAEFNGEIFAPDGVDELSVRAGHIPGAINVVWSEAVNEDGTLKSVEELRKLYADAGIDGSEPIIVYCRIGERASHSWFVLNKILGYDAQLYDGSWTEWGNSVGTPIDNPAGTVWGGV